MGIMRYTLRPAQGEQRKVPPIAVTGNHPNPFGLSLSKPEVLLVVHMPLDKLRANAVRFFLYQVSYPGSSQSIRAEPVVGVASAKQIAHKLTCIRSTLRQAQGERGEVPSMPGYSERQLFILITPNSYDT